MLPQRERLTFPAPRMVPSFAAFSTVSESPLCRERGPEKSQKLGAGGPAATANLRATRHGGDRPAGTEKASQMCAD